MSTPEKPKPPLDPFWEQQFEAMSIALLGLADRVEALEARLGHGDRERERKDILPRLDALEDSTGLLAEAVIQLDEVEEPVAPAPKQRPLLVRFFVGFWRLITT
jgi:hypothetical protein